MNIIRKSLAAALLASAASLTYAQSMPPLGAVPQLPWYIGVGIGGGHLNRSADEFVNLGDSSLDTSDKTYTVRGGWRFSPFFAVELGYYDLGRYDFSGTIRGTNIEARGSGRAKSVGLSLVGIIPIDTVDLYGRIGYAHSELKFNGNTEQFTSSTNQRQDEATYGLGARWTFTPHWALFGEWMKNDRIRVDSWMGGIDYRF